MRYVKRFGFAALMVLAGLALNFLQIKATFEPFGTVGDYLIFIGIGGAILLAFMEIRASKMKGVRRDERTEIIQGKAARYTLFFIFAMMFAGLVTFKILGIELIPVEVAVSTVGFATLFYFAAT